MVSSDFYVQDNSDLEEKTLDAAKKLSQDGKYAEALKLYQGMLNTSISHRLYYEIGKCYYKLNDFLAAEDNFKKSISLEEFKNASYLYIGNIYYKKADSKNAIENWAAYYAYKPDDAAVCLNLATSYFAKGMRFQAIFYYEKYLKYSKDKGSSYQAIKSSIDKCTKAANDFFQKAKRAVSARDNKSAIEFLTYAEKNVPTNFDINLLLGKLYLEENEYMRSLIYLKRALCLDNHSLDVLQKLTAVYINLGDFTAAYCSMRRLLPLVLNNQKEYLKTLKLVKTLEESFDEHSYQGHKEWALKYDNENNYHMALIEYENCIILKDSLKGTYEERIERLKSFLKPEERIVKICLEKGSEFYNNGNFRTSNKYFSKVMLMTNRNSSEYKLAKSRFVDV